MEKGYAPDGWLGIVLGAKIYVNFMREISFKDCFIELQRQMSLVIGDSNAVKALNSKPRNNIDAWSQSDVLEWLNRCCKNREIRKILENFDGKKLEQLHSMKKNAESYFYDVISNKQSIDIFSVLDFVVELEKLF